MQFDALTSSQVFAHKFGVVSKVNVLENNLNSKLELDGDPLETRGHWTVLSS